MQVLSKREEKEWFSPGMSSPGGERSRQLDMVHKSVSTQNRLQWFRGMKKKKERLCQNEKKKKNAVINQKGRKNSSRQWVFCFLVFSLKIWTLQLNSHKDIRQTSLYG